MDFLKDVPVAVCLCIAAVAAYTDWKCRKVKNALIFPAFFAGILWHGITGGISEAVLGFLSALIPLILLGFYVMRMLGAGDIKLLMTIGVWLGPLTIVKIMVYSILCGGMMALVIMVFYRNGLERMKKLGHYFKACVLNRKVMAYEDFSQVDRKGTLPFAIAIFTGLIYFAGTQVGWVPGI